MEISVKKYLSVYALTAGLSVSIVTNAAAAAPSDSTDIQECMANTKLNSYAATGSPYSPGGTKLAWNVSKGCSYVTIETRSFDGSSAVLDAGNLASSGSFIRNPSRTTQYRLYAKIETPFGSQQKLLGTRTALSSKIVDYHYLLKAQSWVQKSAEGADADAAKSIMYKMSNSYTEDAKKLFTGMAIEVHIIPNEAELTDLPLWKHKVGETTCTDDPELPEGGREEGCVEDRPFNELRGLGGSEMSGPNRVTLAVGEEQLITLADPAWPTSRPGYVLAHEFGHAPFKYASSEFRSSVQQILNERGPDGEYVGNDDYASSNIDEYVAMGTTALFRYPNYGTSTHEYSPTWLVENDVPLLVKLKSFYDVSVCSTAGVCY